MHEEHKRHPARRWPPPAAQRAQEQQTTLKFAQCMRSHGVPKFPDPKAGGELKLDTRAIKRVCICGSGVAVLALRRRRRSSITSEVMDGRVPRAKVAWCPSRSQHRVREICCGSGGGGAT
jgi:hypothetical protein